MASLSTLPNGTRRVQFTAPDGSRPTLYLGKIPESEAQKFCDQVGMLVACYGHQIPEDTLRWALKLPTDVYQRLAKPGLLPLEGQGPVSQNTAPTLGALIADLLTGLSGTKPNTQRNYRCVFRHVAEHFGDGRQVNTITPHDADMCVAWMRTKLGTATVSRNVKACRMLFKKAMRWGWLDTNPFDGIRAGSQANHARKAFIPLNDFQRLLDATDDLQFRCVLALSRIGALRTPSETGAVRWADVQWDRGTLLIRSTKTEGHKGGESRVIPLFPELSVVLSAWQMAAPVGEEHVVTASEIKNWRTRLGRLILKAGLKPWPRLFHNLRASRESELVARFPLTTVCDWLGHSPEVSAGHYLQDPDKDGSFQKAIQEKTTYKTTLNGQGQGSNKQSHKSENPQNPLKTGHLAGSAEGTNYPRRESNNSRISQSSKPISRSGVKIDVRTVESSGEDDFRDYEPYDEGGGLAEHEGIGGGDGSIAAFGGDFHNNQDPELRAVLSHWDRLSADARASIAQLVRSYVRE